MFGCCTLSCKSPGSLVNKGSMVKVPSPAYRQEESRFVEPALFLSASRSPLNPWVQGLRLASKASVRGKLRLRHAALSGCYRIRRCRGFAVYIRFDFHSFASELALGKSKRLCMAHWTRNLPQHSFVEIRHIVWRIFFA